MSLNKNRNRICFSSEDLGVCDQLLNKIKSLINTKKLHARGRLECPNCGCGIIVEFEKGYSQDEDK